MRFMIPEENHPGIASGRDWRDEKVRCGNHVDFFIDIVFTRG